MGKLDKAIETIRDSEAYQQIKAKYDELDSQTKLYVNLGAVAGVVFVIFLSMVIGMAKLRGMKSDLDDREELIGYLQRSADQIKTLRAAQNSSHGSDLSSPLGQFVTNVLVSMATTRIDPTKVDVGSEKPGEQDKDSVETTLDVKMTQVNIRQITNFLFELTQQGSARGLNVKNLSIDTKGDPSGWMNATMTLATYKAK